MWIEDQGVLTFEWILLITILAIGIVGGLSAVRDAVISELGDVSHAVTAVDQSYTVLTDPCLEIGNEFGFQDEEEMVKECRPDQPAVSQGGEEGSGVGPRD